MRSFRVKVDDLIVEEDRVRYGEPGRTRFRIQYGRLGGGTAGKEGRKK